MGLIDTLLMDNYTNLTIPKEQLQQENNYTRVLSYYTPFGGMEKVSDNVCMSFMSFFNQDERKLKMI